MHEIAPQFSAALQQYLASNSVAAERMCREILVGKSDDVNALHLLGLLASQSGRTDLAIECLERAVQLRGDDAELHNNLGTARSRHGDLDGAVACHRRAIELNPRFAPARLNLANALRQRGELAEAIAEYRAALQINPNYAEGHRLLGSALVDCGDFESAVACCQRALQINPNYAEAFHDLGNAHNEKGEFAEAQRSYLRAIELKPDFSDAYNGLGDVLRKQDRFEEAEQACRRAIELNPKLAAAHNNLGNALQGLGRLSAAIECFREAIRLQPKLASPHYNLGHAFRDLERLSEAAESYRRALEADPSHAGAHNDLGNTFMRLRDFELAAVHYDRALELQPELAIGHLSKAGLALLQQDFELGWQEYEWRWKMPDVGGERVFEEPKWDGRPLANKTILIYAEQGFGDTLQFVRYASLVHALGARIVFECQRPLLRLLSHCEGIDDLVGVGDKLPPFDFQIALLSVPRILKTTLKTIPTRFPYLFADPTLVAQWRDKLQPLKGLRIGINWHGRGGRGTFRRRDLPLADLLALGSQLGQQFVCLQREIEPAEQAQLADAPNIVRLGDHVDTIHGAFMDTAAVMKNLDLVITSDTAIAHLAGGLGVPVWVGLPFVPDWRWLLDRADSPWYPTMRLFRQKSPGDWTEVFREMKVALQERLSSV